MLYKCVAMLRSGMLRCVADVEEDEREVCESLTDVAFEMEEAAHLVGVATVG